MKKGSVAFANFICTFGDKGGLLDQSNITMQAFLTDTLIRTYGNGRYHLYDAKIVEMGNADGTPILALRGHFVKNTILSREQLFDADAGLVASRQSMESSPSAFFLLILNTHRLVYYAETSHAPDLKSFEATMAHFIKRIREQQIETEYRSKNNKKTRVQLQRELPRPSVKITPLSETGKINDAIRSFAKIKSIRFRLIRPNHESDAAEVVGAVQGRFSPLQPDRLDILASRSDGLDISEVEEAVEETTQSGNTEILVTGEDIDGSRIKVSNNEFALTSDLVDAAKTDGKLGRQLFQLYSKFVAAGKIKINAIDAEIAKQINTLAGLL